MARIRTVKPEFWTDPVMVGLTPLARLFYIGTWNFAMCDQGHLEDDPFRLKLQILPVEDCDVAALIDELVKAKRLSRIKVDGDAYLHVKTLSSHQRVDGRWTPRCPVCTHANSRELTRVSANSRELTQTPAVKESKVKESNVADAPPPRPEVAALCDLLADLIEANGSKRPNITKGWTNAARLMLDRDEYDYDMTVGLIRWCQEDDFWRTNILSMPKFREKYDQLRLAAARNVPKAKATGTKGWWSA